MESTSELISKLRPDEALQVRDEIRRPAVERYARIMRSDQGGGRLLAVSTGS